MPLIQTVPVSVRLYRSTAEIIRSGSLQLPQGKTTVQISGLTPSADTDSMRLWCSEGIQLRNLRVEQRQEPGEAVKDLVKQIDALKQQNAVREIQRKLWETNGDFSARTSLSASELSDYIRNLPDELSALYEATVACNERIQEKEKELEIAQVKEGGPLVIAELDVPQAGDCTFQLQYSEPSAGWDPLYEIHTDGEGPLELRLRASMRQTSGEDWEKVRLTILSGTPNGNNTLPVRSTEYVDAVEPVKLRQNHARANGMAMGVGMKAMVMEDAAVMEEVPMMGAAMAMMSTPQVEETSGTLMNEYDLGEGHTIRSSSSESMADLQSYSLAAVYQIKTAPRLDPHAYLTAEIRTEELPFLYSNQADVYLLGQRIGDVWLSSDDAEETQTLSLGKEERIRIQAKEVSRKQSKTLLKGQNVRELVYETTVSNTLDHPVTILIQDQIPVAASTAVTVESQQLSDYQLNAETGYLEQVKTLAAKESCSIRFGYKITWPKDRELNVTRSSSSGRKFCPECGALLNGPRCHSCGWHL